MKILSIPQIREADEYTIKNEPIASIDLMERAATECYKWIKKRLKPSKKISLFCGIGNNGGDGLVIARLLHNKGFHVEVNIIRFSDKCSDDFKANEERLKEFHNLKVNNIAEDTALPKVEDDNVVIDAIFGSGLARPVKGFIADVVDHINESKAITIAIDAPSGLFCDEDNTTNTGSIVKADYTLTFQCPKYAFFFAENDLYLGDWYVIDIGLHKNFINRVKTSYFFITRTMIKSFLKTRHKYDHKGNYGHGLLVSGMYGKMGAAVLGAKACLRAGVGLLTAHIPQCGYNIFQSSIPEAMVNTDESTEVITRVGNIQNHNAIAIGPGIGKSEETAKSLKLLIQETSVPLVLDADAINILAENKTWLAFLPQNTMLTPHPGEFERLTEKASSAFERVEIQKNFAIKHGLYIVLKGAHTSIATPNGEVYFNSSGNPGMATAGSGDVLTGILLSLLAQGYSCQQAALLGTYLHGLAGDMAAKKTGAESLIAKDIIANLHKAYLFIHEA